MNETTGRMRRVAPGTCTDVSIFVPYLLAIGLAPFGVALLLCVATRLEASLPRDEGMAFSRRQ